MALPKKLLEEKLHSFFREDVGQGDITTLLTVPGGTRAEADIIAKEKGIIAGIEEAKALLESLGVDASPLVTDGSEVEADTPVMKLRGDARTILSAERTVLNVMSRMSGIATEVRRIVEKVRSASYSVRIACTRKTAPGLLYFDKRAVMIGGGDTHRLHLNDMILIKDNHIKIAGSIGEAIRRAKMASFAKKIEVEVCSVEDAIESARAGVDIVMLDNMTPSQVRTAIDKLKEEGLRDEVLVEVSGGITEENILEYASAMPDIISLGALTESPRSLDLSLEITSVERV